MAEEFVDPEGPEILVEEVTKSINGLKEKKAPREDGISGEHLKTLAGESLNILTVMLSDIYNTGSIPKYLKLSVGYLWKFLKNQNQQNTLTIGP